LVINILRGQTSQDVSKALPEVAGFQTFARGRISAFANTMALGIALMSVQLVVPFGVPIPSPTATGAGLRLVSVMLTVPACETVNV
jgi:hypothetical protein